MVPCALHFGMREKAWEGGKMNNNFKMSTFLIFAGEGTMKAQLQSFFFSNQFPKKCWTAHDLLKSTFVLQLKCCCCC